MDMTQRLPEYHLKDIDDLKDTQTELDLHLARLKALWPHLNFSIAEIQFLDDETKLAILKETFDILNI
jgi:hypothetical protein